MYHKLQNKLLSPATVIKFTFIQVLLLCFVFSVFGQDKSSKSLLILHTNDIHDHLRPDYDGKGGLPFVSGFIQNVRGKRDDVLVLDAGDFAEKGDLVSRKTGSELTFEAVSRVGYDAWAPGNHDHDYGIEVLHRFEDLTGVELLCINLLKEDGSLEFTPSKIFKIDELKVGIIGAIRPRDTLSLNWEETANIMAQEAKKLKKETDIIIAVVHMSVERSTFISNIASGIDVFISGHSHKKLEEVKRVSETNALIVQAGSYGDYVGWLELIINPDGQITMKDYDLKPMVHEKVEPDLEMIEWIRNKELEIVPEAQKIISWASREIGSVEVGYLAAEALRKSTGSDVAFNHSAEIIRSNLPSGLIDLNAFYRTGGERGKDLVVFELSGSEIMSYLRGMEISEWYQTQWSGFYSSANDKTFDIELHPEKQFRVVMPQREYDRRFRRLFKRIEESPDEWPNVSGLNGPVNPKPIDITWTDAIVQLVSTFNKRNSTLEEELQRIIKETGQVMHLEFEGKYN